MTVTNVEVAPPLVVVMGVSGCGKSTIGKRIAERLDVRFIDGDDLHPLANLTKMSTGIPLTDADRWPWLRDIGRALHDQERTGLVIACSALRRVYRTTILREAPNAVFMHLRGEGDLIGARLARRDAHFMPATLLQSQFDTLEPLAENEPGLVVDIDAAPDEIVETAVHAIVEREVAAARKPVRAVAKGATTL